MLNASIAPTMYAITALAYLCSGVFGFSIPSDTKIIPAIQTAIAHVSKVCSTELKLKK